MLLPPHWAATEHAVNDVVQCIDSNRHQLLDAYYEAGPVDDARRAGIEIETVGRIAVIPVTGLLMKRPTSFERRLFGASSTSMTGAAIQSAALDKGIDSILLWVDSPGGTVDGTAELADTVVAASKKYKKRTVAHIDGLGASAAYWIASQAQEVYATRMSQVGSIGVRMMAYDWSRMFENEGITPVVVDTGQHKSAGAPGTKITDTQRAEWQRVVDGMFEQFKGAISSARGLKGKRLDAVTEGQVWLGTEAVDLGLIDGTQSLDATLADLHKKANNTTNTRTRYRAQLTLQNQRLALLGANMEG